MATTRTANLKTISNEEVSTILATENALITTISEAVEKWHAFQKQKNVMTIKEAAAQIRALPIKDDGYIVVRDAPDFAELTAKQLGDIAKGHKRNLKADLPTWALDTNQKLIKILTTLTSSMPYFEDWIRSHREVRHQGPCQGLPLPRGGHRAKLSATEHH